MKPYSNICSAIPTTQQLTIMLHDAILSDNAQAFIETYDKMQPCIPHDQPSISDGDLKSKIKCQIFTNNENGIPYAEILKLKEELYYYSSLCCSEAKKYFSIIHCISYLRSTSDSLIIDFNNSNWKEAISNIESYIRMDPHCGEIFECDDAAVLSESAKNLINIGASISLENGRLIINNPDFIENEIIQRIKNISIFSLYEHMLSDLFYHEESHRLMYDTKMIPVNKIIPYNYLIRNSKKCTSDVAKNNKKEIDELISLTTDFIAIHHPYNHKLDIYPPTKEDLDSKEYISSIINQYNYYYIKQSDIDYVISIIDFLQDNLANHVSLSNYDLTPIKQIAIIIRDNSDKKNIKNVNIDESLFTADYSSLLTDYAQTEEIDEGIRPFLKIGTSYYVLPMSIAAHLLYQTIIAIIEMRCDSSDERAKLGELYEDYIKDLLHQKSISTISGKYNGTVFIKKDNKQDKLKLEGESDIILESENFISLIEIKKRLLSKKNELIDQYSLISDLSGSLLSSFYQNVRTNCVLNSRKEILFKEKNGRTSNIVPGNRSIIKVSLALGDYSTINGTHTSAWITDFLIRYKFSITWSDMCADEKFRSNIERQYKSLKEIQEKIRCYRKLPNVSKLYSNNIFMSFEQLYHILKLSANSEELANLLSKLVHISTSSDFHADIFITHKLFADFSPDPKFVMIPACPIGSLLSN